MTKLSEVPFELLQTKKNWLTGHTGMKGTIREINVNRSGSFFETYLDIVWENGVVSHRVKFPDEGEYITVEGIPKMLIHYVDNKVELLKKHQQLYLDNVIDPVAFDTL